MNRITIESTTDGRYMILVSGLQWGGDRDASGAGDATFESIAEARQTAEDHGLYDYTEDQDFKAGDRVELHPAHDLWMRGARFATVARVGSSLIFVDVDKAPAKQPRWFHKASLRHVR